MKHDTTYSDGIEANLRAMAELLDRASRTTKTAYAAIRKNEQNLAIGTVIAVEDDLEAALALYKGTIAMHRATQRRAYA